MNKFIKYLFISILMILSASLGFTFAHNHNDPNHKTKYQLSARGTVLYSGCSILGNLKLNVTKTEIEEENKLKEKCDKILKENSVPESYGWPIKYQYSSYEKSSDSKFLFYVNYFIIISLFTLIVPIAYSLVERKFNK